MMYDAPRTKIGQYANLLEYSMSSSPHVLFKT
jgi:hypothetical protein